MSYKRVAKPVVRLLFVILIMYTAIYGAIFILRFALAVDSPMVVVEGTSMNPTLYEGDILIIQGAANKSKIEPSRDIIIFHSTTDWNLLIVHRVIFRFIENDQLYFQTQGDNNPGPDPVISANNVVGVVLWKIPVPVIGSIILFTQTLIGRFVLIIIMIFIVIDMFYSKDDESFIKGKS